MNGAPATQDIALRDNDGQRQRLPTQSHCVFNEPVILRGTLSRYTTAFGSPGKLVSCQAATVRRTPSLDVLSGVAGRRSIQRTPLLRCRMPTSGRGKRERNPKIHIMHSLTFVPKTEQFAIIGALRQGFRASRRDG